MKKMRRLYFISLILLISCQRTACRDTHQGVSLEKGRHLYDLHCASCHGVSGDGKGRMAEFLWPKPRDFTKGIFKYRSGRGPIPSDLDLLETMYHGIPGTSMPGWYLLKKEDWESLLAHLKTLSPKLLNAKAGASVDIPEEPKLTPESAQKGKDLYAQSGCVACHGVNGAGDGPGAAVLTDVWGNTITPRDLTRGPMKWGNTSRGIYRTLSIGVPGTPMPSFEHTFTKEEMWAVVHYLQSIQKPLPEGYNTSNPERNLLVVKKIEGELPLDYENELWQTAPANPVLLKPLWYEPKAAEWLTIKALHNGKEAAFYIRWEDDQMDIDLDKNDAMAIQFPVEKISDPIDLPYLGMGNEGMKVNIWEWKAGTFLDWNAEGVDRLKLQKASEQDVTGKGTYDNGEWHVIFKREIAAYDRQDAPIQKLGYLSFALWDYDLPKHKGPESFSEWLAYELKD